MIAAAAVLLLLAGQAPQLPPRDTRPGGASAPGSIAGVVVTDEAQPRPLRRARVTLTGAGLDAPLTAITGDDGAFAFGGVPEGRFTVTAYKDAYVAMAYGATRPGRPGTGVHVAAGRAVGVTLRLPRGGVMTGTVLGIDGRPAVGITVAALYARAGSGFVERQYGPPPGVIPGVTDDRGVYRIYGLPAGDYLVSAQPLIRQAGVSVADGEVRMMLRDNQLSRPMVLAHVLHPGVADVSRAVRVPVRAGEERGGVDIQLEYVPLANVSGTVSSPVGWSRATITLWRTEESTQPQGGSVAAADEQGRFTFRAVRPGSYRVTARATQLSGGGGRGGGPAGDVQYGFADITVNGEDIDGVSMALQPGLTIAGQVVFDSAQGAAPSLPPQLRLPTLFLTSAGGAWQVPPVMIDGTRFRIDGVAPGLYRIPAAPPGMRTPLGAWWLTSLAAGGRELLDAPLAVQQSVDDAIVTFTDRASELAGSLRDAQGAGVSTLYVVAFPVDRAAWFFNSRRIAAVRPGRDGQWSIRNLPPGEYHVTAADLDVNEWFDPSSLERLIGEDAKRIRISGAEKYSLDLVLR